MTKKIKILHITYDMRIGGTEMVVKNIIDGSNRELFDMSVLCIESPLGTFANDLINEGIEFHEFNRQPGFDNALIKSIRQTIKKENIDIIHCHQYTPWVYGVIAAMFTRTKVVFTEHGRFYPDSSSWKRKLINPILNMFTNKVTAISKATKQALVDFENIPEKSIEVIYNGITPLTFKENKLPTLRRSLNIPNDHIVLGTVARFDPIKNHSMMLTAFSQVLHLHPKSTLLIVGDGEERNNIEACINNLKINDNVILVGYEPKPAEHIALMDIFLLSSLSEGTSMTLLEAMSIGKPCVVTNAGGNPEIIIDQENGYVTENDNADEFSAACIRLIANEALKKQFSIKSEQQFTSNFAQEKMNTIYHHIYKSLKSI